VANVGEDDIGLIEDFLSNPAGTGQPRQLLVQGDGFAEQCDANGGVHLDFLNNYLFAGFRDASYSDLTPSLVTCPDLISAPSLVYSAADVYGVVNTCVTLNDVLDPGTVEASVASSYEAVGGNAPYRSGIEHTATGAHNWHSIINGWDIFNTVVCRTTPTSCSTRSVPPAAAGRRRAPSTSPTTSTVASS
jgi:hypothetical protein